MRVRFETFASSWSSWDELFAQAAEFATALGPARLINISHSCDQNKGVVTVWYWDEDGPTPPPAAPSSGADDWGDR